MNRTHDLVTAASAASARRRRRHWRLRAVLMVSSPNALHILTLVHQSGLKRQPIRIFALAGAT